MSLVFKIRRHYSYKKKFYFTYPIQKYGIVFDTLDVIYTSIDLGIQKVVV